MKTKDFLAKINAMIAEVVALNVKETKFADIHHIVSERLSQDDAAFIPNTLRQSAWKIELAEGYGITLFSLETDGCFTDYKGRSNRVGYWIAPPEYVVAKHLPAVPPSEEMELDTLIVWAKYIHQEEEVRQSKIWITNKEAELQKSRNAAAAEIVVLRQLKKKLEEMGQM